MYAFWSDQEVSISLFIVFLWGFICLYCCYICLMVLFWILICIWDLFICIDIWYCHEKGLLYHVSVSMHHAYLYIFCIFMFFEKNDWASNFSILIKIYSWRSLLHRLLTSLLFFTTCTFYFKKLGKKKLLNKLYPLAYSLIHGEIYTLKNKPTLSTLNNRIIIYLPFDHFFQRRIWSLIW